MPPAHVSFLFLKDVVGFGLVNTLTRTAKFPKLSQPKERQTAIRTARVVFTLSSLALIWRLELGVEVLLFWVIPFVTWLQVCLHVRSIAEHFALDPAVATHESRTVLLTVLDRTFILSNATSLHGEHHFYPSVPFYRLRTLHDAIYEDPIYERTVEVTRGYWDVIRSCWRKHSIRGESA